MLVAMTTCGFSGHEKQSVTDLSVLDDLNGTATLTLNKPLKQNKRGCTAKLLLQGEDFKLNFSKHYHNEIECVPSDMNQ